MSASMQFVRRWVDAVLSPKISDEALSEALAKARQRLPVPVVWLLGKTQSGKTSLVRAVTGATDAEIGAGYKPCTRTARVFDFPDAQTAFLRFLDTRGLGEAGYSPSEDMAVCEQQAHLLVVTAKALDHRLSDVIAPLQRIHQAHPEWPVVVVQSCLHEGYPSAETEHIQPYPFGAEPWPVSVPPDLRRSLLKQRELFAGIPAHFVPVDFTLPEDGYTPVLYGLEALWEVLESALPLGWRGILVRSAEADAIHDLYAETARPHIVGYAISAGCAAAIPIPVASLATVLGLQAKLFHSIAAIYGLPLTRQSLAEIGGAVGLSALTGIGGRELAKLIPGYGQTVGLGVAALYTGAMTYALGRMLCFYFTKTLRGEAFTDEALRKVYTTEFERGREILGDALRGQPARRS